MTINNEWQRIAFHLRDLLDDIDTATDAYKPDNSHKFTQYVYRKIKQANTILCSRNGQDWERGEPTKWYDCAHCDAGYVDQECICGEALPKTAVLPSTDNSKKSGNKEEVEEAISQITNAANKAFSTVIERGTRKK